MQIIKFLNITKDDQGTMSMPAEAQNMNHVKTMHAAAQFALAEFASGSFLQDKFPEYKDRILGLVRKSRLRYRNAAETTLKAVVSMSADDEKNLITRIITKGRAQANIDVLLIDENGKTTLEASFEWFLARKTDNEKN